MKVTVRDIFFLAVGGLIFSALCFFVDFNIFGGTHAKKIFHTWDSSYFHDSVVTVLLRHDTIKVPHVIREQVLATPLDDSPCPKIEYRSETVHDTIHIIGDCESRSFPLIDVRSAPIVQFRTDTVMRVITKEIVREKEVSVVEKKRWLLITAFGEFTNVLERKFEEWAIGIRADISFGDVGLYAAPHYEDSLKIALGGEVVLFDR